MKFGIEKCVMLIMKKVKSEIVERIEQKNQESFSTPGEKGNG